MLAHRDASHAFSMTLHFNDCVVIIVMLTNGKHLVVTAMMASIFGEMLHMRSA
jgi:hypothetical protein